VLPQAQQGVKVAMVAAVVHLPEGQRLLLLVLREMVWSLQDD